MNPSLEFSQKFVVGYNAACKPLCQELKLPQTALDILLFLVNNPEYKTASDIVEVRKLKANLVSVNVDRLVQEGYLTIADGMGSASGILLGEHLGRGETEKARSVVERGREVQNRFLERLLDHTDEAQRAAFFATLETMSKNLDAIIEGED